MESGIDKIEKRTFKCGTCNFQSVVFGEMYFDSGCHNYMATFVCLRCKNLFESIISKRIWLKDRDSRESIFNHRLTFDLADKEEIICLNCGTTDNSVWNKDSGVCPKCGGSLNCTIDGYYCLKT